MTEKGMGQGQTGLLSRGERDNLALCDLQAAAKNPLFSFYLHLSSLQLCTAELDLQRLMVLRGLLFK